MRAAEMILLLALTFTVVCGEALAAGFLPANATGWHTWQVDEPNSLTAMCCSNSRRGDDSEAGCNLDSRNISFSDGGSCAATPGPLQVYVRLEGGRVKDIRMLSANCVVATDSKIADQGLVSVGENIGWFRSVVEDRSLAQSVREEALFALASSGSDSAYAYLDGLLSRR